MTVPHLDPPSTFTIADCVWTSGLGGYYADDLQAIQAGAVSDGLVYRGSPRTPGHAAVRNPALAVLVLLTGDDGTIGTGDIVTPQYSGFAGRDLPIDPPALEAQMRLARTALRDAGALTFAEGCALIEQLRLDDRPMHTGVRYGVSQALLGLAAAAAGRPAACVLADLFGTTRLGPVPIYAQSGEERRRNVDKMVLKRVDVLPHGLINSPSAFGPDGDALIEYAGWVSRRVVELGEPGYRPRLHFDVYGMPGIATNGNVDAMVRICERLVATCAPFAVQVEAPIYGADSIGTARLLAELREGLRRGGVDVAIVADDWCNSLDDITWFAEQGAADVIQIKVPDLGSLTNALEAARRCRSAGVGAYVGGSCTETDVSARASVHLAVAVDAHQVLAKPGMGVDEGIAIVGNEMRRLLLQTGLPS
jgi:methylaspartate ammonia-lyase